MTNRFKRHEGTHWTLVASLALVVATITNAQVTPEDYIPGEVVAYQKISSTEGGFGGPLANDDMFGTDVAVVGDIDGDLIEDLAVSAHRDGDGGDDSGAVWILFLNSNGTVRSAQKISATQGQSCLTLVAGDTFGYGLSAIGDRNGDRVPDLAVGAGGHDNPVRLEGALYLLYLNSDGTVGSCDLIDASILSLNQTDEFGRAVECIGDLNGDTVPDLAVGAGHTDVNSVANEGVVWILFLNPYNDPGGPVHSSATISAPDTGTQVFGDALALVDDAILAVGTYDPGTPNRGAVWVFDLASTGAGTGQKKVTAGVGGLPTCTVDGGDYFGYSLAALGDWDGDSINDLATGTLQDGSGSVWILFLNADHTVKGYRKVSATTNPIPIPYEEADGFGSGVALLCDFDGNGKDDLVVGATGDDDGGPDHGAAWILFMDDGPLGWVNLGFGLAGTTGEPVLDGVGTLFADCPVSLELSNALHSSPASLVIGFETTYSPFKGGTFVPHKDVLVTATTGTRGGIELQGSWPTGVPSGFALYFQYWIDDPLGPMGCSASNAVAAVTP